MSRNLFKVLPCPCILYSLNKNIAKNLLSAQQNASHTRDRWLLAGTKSHAERPCSLGGLDRTHNPPIEADRPSPPHEMFVANAKVSGDAMMHSWGDVKEPTTGEQGLSNP